jgi:hypothetical protein
MHIVDGAMEATGSLTWPLPMPFQALPTRATVPPSGIFQVRHGRFPDVLGLRTTDADWNDADLDIVPPGRLMLRQLVTEGTTESVRPGLRGQLGGGALTAQGEVDFPSFRLDQLDRARYDLTGDLDPVGVTLGEWLKLKLHGRLRVVTEEKEVEGRPRSRPRVETAPGSPLVVDEGFVGVPPADQLFSLPGQFPITPAADITFLTGRHVDFRYGAIRAQVLPGGPPAAPTSGYVRLTGSLTAQEAVLDGTFRAAAGRLNFPGGALDLHSATATVSKVAGSPPRVLLEAEASGQIGDYNVVLSPSGQVFPFPAPGEGGFSLGARSIPYLDEPFVLALLLGPTITPAVGAQTQTAELLTTPWSSPTYAGTITGLAVPLVLGNLALNYEFEGPVSLRLRQRLFGRLYAAYLAPVTGPAESRRLALTYDIAPRWSVGWSDNALDQSRWQVQSYFAF